MLTKKATALDAQDLRDKIENMDNVRRNHHNASIATCGIINKLCEGHGMEPFCPESDDRHVVADFVGRFVATVFMEEIGEKSVNIDELVSKMDGPLSIQSAKDITDDFEER